jgi:polysaccharide export outer membrane protein
MPLIEIIRDPRQNIHLRSGDVVTALFQSNSFTALGASGRNEEIDFEAQGITLAQALGRIGGLQDMRFGPAARDCRARRTARCRSSTVPT